MGWSLVAHRKERGRRRRALPSSSSSSSSSSGRVFIFGLVLFIFIIFPSLASASSSSSPASPASFYSFFFSRFSPFPSSSSSSSSSEDGDVRTAPPAAVPPRLRSEGGAVPWEDELTFCNCTAGENCCYWSDRPFCCPSSTVCCGSRCCPADGVCCRSRSWQGVTTCCTASQYCTSTGDCSVLPINRGNNWSLLPLMIGSFVMTFIVCCCTCVCISRINRRRALLAAASANPALLNNPSTNSAYRTFHPRGSYTKNQGVTAKLLQTFPTQNYHPGCMPLENAQCSICLLEYETGDRFRTLPCNHHFHQPCIDRWLSDHDTCPLCVQVVTQSINK